MNVSSGSVRAWIMATQAFKWGCTYRQIEGKIKFTDSSSEFWVRSTISVTGAIAFILYLVYFTYQNKKKKSNCFQALPQAVTELYKV